jgi:small subunit ribosomal protein S1
VSESEEDFAAMFEASLKAKRFEKGQTIEGTIVAIGPAVAFVDVGGKGEAMIEISELRDAEGNLEVAAGDRIQAMVVSTVGGLTLSRTLALGAATWRQLEDAFQAGLPVEGRVERAVKGGYEVRIARQRAFCPISQIDTRRNADPAEYEGRVYKFRIIEFKEGGKDLVVSRRALVEEEERAGAAEIRRTIVPGAVLAGRVSSVREFGAFVNLGAGVEGLLHVSEMGWSRVSDPSQVVQPGDAITVKVLRVDEATQKISLGLKQLTGDPWAEVQAAYEVGQVRTGRVTRVAEFGAFVELEPGIEGLAHASTFAPTGRADGWRQSITVDMTGAFEILSIEPDKKRIGLALVPEGSARADTAASTPSAIVAGARLTGKVERHEKFGVFVFLAPGRTGLVPLSETGLTRDADVVKAFPVGSDMEIVVLDVESPNRIRLSRKAVQDAQEAKELTDYAARPDAAPPQGFGSLADKLRGALAPREK